MRMHLESVWEMSARIRNICYKDDDQYSVLAERIGRELLTFMPAILADLSILVRENEVRLEGVRDMFRRITA
jgi:hypothetical protein